MEKFKRGFALASAGLLLLLPFSMAGCSENNDTVVLRVANWEEYIDLGDWDEDELIDIDNPYAAEGETGIIGVNSMIDDFTEWFNGQDYGFKVSVEYSTFGTNEDLYNRLNLGDTYDLVCPSDYMIMKLIDADKVEKFSEDFKNEEIEENYYAQNVSRYIDCDEESIFSRYEWDDYAACYMWGTTGIIYNGDKLISESDVSSWDILTNQNYNRQVTVKDNVRDAYFAALAIKNKELIADTKPDQDTLSALLNATDDPTIESAEQILKDIKDNVYSFETDSGKADMVTGKVIANFQWSGDAVYIMDEAETDEEAATELWYSVPEECTNLWFDGWIMLKDGIQGNSQRKTAAEAFINFLSRPDNAIRNMYYIGYTSAIAGQTMFDYVDWNYGYDFDTESEYYYETEDLYCYDLSHFFGNEIDSALIVDIADLEVTSAQLLETIEEGGKTYNLYGEGTISRGRQLFAQYPSEEIIGRSVVMLDFGDKLGDINQMWINVRCQDLLDIDPAVIIVVSAVIVLLIAAALIYRFRYAIFKPHIKKGYKKVN